MPTFPFSRRGLLWLGLVGLTVTAHGTAAETPAEATIQKFYSALLGIMQAGRTTPFIQRFDALAPALEQAINLPAILQAAVGLAWTTFQPSQQTELQTAFRRYTVATWVSNFDSYSGQQLQVNGTRNLGSAEIVHTEIVKSSGGSNVIDYVMRQADGMWKATDVLLDGSISQVAVLRSDFRALLVRGPMALADDLERKATELMGGTAPM